MATAPPPRRAWRLLAVVVSLVISAAMIYAQTTEVPRQVEVPAAQPTEPVEPGAAPPAPTPRIATPEEAQELANSAPTAAQDFETPLPASVGVEDGLQVKSIWAARAISVLFPQITTIYGYRQDALRWHPEGLAIDVMIPDYHSPEGIELGNQIAGIALANAERWGVLHVIWRQGIYPGIGTPSWMADYGSETLNHFDHVHIATDGGGYPSGQETYFIGSMSPPPPQ